MNVDLNKRPNLIQEYPSLQEIKDTDILKEFYLDGCNYFVWDAAPAQLREQGFFRVVVDAIQQLHYRGINTGFRVFRVGTNSPGFPSFMLSNDPKTLQIELCPNIAWQQNFLPLFYQWLKQTHRI